MKKNLVWERVAIVFLLVVILIAVILDSNYYHVVKGPVTSTALEVSNVLKFTSTNNLDYEYSITQFEFFGGPFVSITDSVDGRKVVTGDRRFIELK